MPALYRMPVVYLVAGIAIAAILVSNRFTPVEPTSVAEVLPTKPRTVQKSSAETPVIADLVLRTPSGLRRKVLIQTLGAVARQDADSSPVPLDYLSILFVFGEKLGALQVGPAVGPPLGWLEASAALEWDTRLMARPSPREGRPAVVVYAEKLCLLDFLAGRSCPRHAVRCPTEGEEADASDNAPPPALGLPILMTESIPQPDGSHRTIHEVATPVRDMAAPVAPSEPSADLRPLLQTVYLSVTIDTTASMGATIAAARVFAEQLVSQAQARYQGVTLRLALVEYRDRAQVFGFSTRIASDFVEPSRFLAALKRLEAAKEGDGSVDERVLDGVESSLPRGSGSDASLPHLSWPTGRAGDLATKMVVLIGDAPDHDRDLARATSLSAEAKARGITIATVRIDRPGALSRAEASRYREQWHTLASGSFLPRDASKGFADAIAPVEVDLNGQEGLTTRLQALLDDRVAHAKQLAAIAAAESEGKLVEYTNRHGITTEGLLPVLKDLHRGDEKRASRPNPKFDGRKAPSLRKGWIAESIGRSRMVDLEVLMTKSELDALIDELRGLDQAAVGSHENLEDLLRIGTAALSGEAAFLAEDRGDRTFAEHLRSRQGLPPAKPDSLLLRTQTDLLQADETTRAALDARLGSVLRKMIERRNADDWNDPRRTIDGMAGVPYEWLDW